MYLITGGNGFVGRALTERLTKSGLAWRAAVRSSSGNNQVAVGDIDADTNWQVALSDIDVIVHLAARVHILDTKKDDAKEIWRTNVDGTRNLAEQAVQAGVKRLVFVSSIKVNGEATNAASTVAAFSAFDLPSPIGSYAESKWEAEKLLKQISSRSELEVVIVRPPLIYGPEVRANFLRLSQLVEKGIPLPFGAIKNKRSLAGIDNVVDLLICCSRHSSAAGETFLVSDGEDLSTPELIRLLAVGMDRKARLVNVPPALLRLAGRCLGRRAEIERLTESLQVDIEHTRTTLRWEPPVPAEEGIRRAVAALC